MSPSVVVQQYVVEFPLVMVHAPNRSSSVAGCGGRGVGRPPIETTSSSPLLWILTIATMSGPNALFSFAISSPVSGPAVDDAHAAPKTPTSIPVKMPKLRLCAGRRDSVTDAARLLSLGVVVSINVLLIVVSPFSGRVIAVSEIQGKFGENGAFRNKGWCTGFSCKEI